MHVAEQLIADRIAQSFHFDEEGKTDLQKIIELYPYFGAANYLYAKDLKTQSKETADQQFKKAVLFFSNPMWMQYMLEKEVKQNHLTPEIADAETTNVLIEEEQHDEPVIEETINVEEDKGHLKISGLLKEQAASFAKPVSEKATLAFENIPRHTIDYFESLGIKLDMTQQGELGNKVKKFTDWLKQMKQQSPSPTDLGTDKETEQLIEVLAENSNATKEVITEAMAQVLIKQGKKSKAIELYEKLSFLNPAKSVYFAAKIQELKS